MIERLLPFNNTCVHTAAGLTASTLYRVYGLYRGLETFLTICQKNENGQSRPFLHSPLSMWIYTWENEIHLNNWITVGR